MVVRDLGGGIGQGEKTADIEAPTTPEDNSDDQLGGNHRKEGDDAAAGESKGEDTLDGDGEGDTENEYNSGDEEPGVELRIYAVRHA
jgi:hypothetical protein